MTISNLPNGISKRKNYLLRLMGELFSGLTSKKIDKAQNKIPVIRLAEKNSVRKSKASV